MLLVRRHAGGSAGTDSTEAKDMLNTLPRWEHFDHESDIGVRGLGRSREEAFAQAAQALTAAMTDPGRVVAHESVRVSCQAQDDEMLLVEWLNAVIYEMATRGMIFGRFTVACQGMRLDGEMVGERIDVGRHQPAVEVKAATMACLRVTCDTAGVWTAQCVVDV
jgi:tRNA nucleotidyltransferase (CCA-adding enzyme)